MSFWGIAREILALHKTVESMQTQLDKIETLLTEFNTRLHRVENRAELTVEQSKTATVEKTSEIYGEILERFIRLEYEVKGINNRIKTPKLEE